MKKILVVFSAFILLLGLFGAADAAVTLSFNYQTYGGNQFWSVYDGQPGFVTEDFNAAPGSAQWAWTGNGQFKTGSNSTGAAPAGVGGVADSTQYVAVPQNNSLSDTTFTANLGTHYNYLGLWWGSVDWQFNNIYNKIDLLEGTTVVGSVTGYDLGHPNADGSWTAPNTNLFVNIFSDASFDGIRMFSNTYAFEADNMTVGTVPEPGTMMLLGSGLVGLAGWGRKKFRR